MTPWLQRLQHWLTVLPSPEWVIRAHRTWCPTVLHVSPLNDLVAHDTVSGHCVCGPALEEAPTGTGTAGLLIIHRSLDGRELA